MSALDQAIETRTDPTFLAERWIQMQPMRDLAQVHRQYEPFSPNALLFTDLDETAWYGALTAQALEVRKPLSFFASGHNSYEDPGVVSREVLFEALYHGQRTEPSFTA